MLDVLLASVLFAFVALTGFEAVRGLGATAALLAQRASAAAHVDAAAAMLRGDARSAAAVWKPQSSCGDAVELWQRTSAGGTFVLYALRDGSLVRAAAAGPIDPCDATLALQTLAANVGALTVTQSPATGLPQHADPISGDADGAAFEPAGITAVSADAHVDDASGAPVRSGNDLVEASIVAPPVQRVVDLVAGNRPSGYTQILGYTCNGRCEANGPFPELRNGTYGGCSAGYDFADAPAYYVPAAFGSVATGNGNSRIVITAYTVTGGYTFAFGGPSPLTAERTWTPAQWPPPGSALAATIADPYPLDYANNAVHARGVAQLASDLGEPVTYAAALTACGDMQADATYAG